MEQRSSIKLDNRNTLALQGITRVISFTPSEFNLETTAGNLKIKGDKLEMGNLNLDRQELLINGKVNAVIYTDGTLQKKQESLFSKLFK